MNYIEYSFNVDEPQGEILVAFLSDMGFESFVYENGAQLCYITQSELLENKALLREYLSDKEHSVREIEQQNWNAVWEADFEPIEIDSRLSVRAPFHPKSQCEREILIDPNMSFGTGHHPTTFMMLSELLDMKLHQKSVMDVGCGSGVLSIFAAMSGAVNVVGVEIDEWAARSARENVASNSVEVEVITGEIFSYNGLGEFDVVVANINRNILYNQMAEYSMRMKCGGELLCSGFYVGEDTEILQKRAADFSLSLSNHREREGWALLHFTKKNDF